MLFTCRDCNKVKQKLKTDVVFCKGKKYVSMKYVDENSRPWHGRRCPECESLRRREKQGSVSIDNVRYERFRIGRRAERLAKRYFENMGIKVEMTKMHGPDLILNINDLKLTCEVKAARWSKRGYLVTSQICKNRRGDDLIAVVMPNKSVYIETMPEWQKKASITGSRYLTKYYRKA